MLRLTRVHSLPENSDYFNWFLDNSLKTHILHVFFIGNFPFLMFGLLDGAACQLCSQFLFCNGSHARGQRW